MTETTELEIPETMRLEDHTPEPQVREDAAEASGEAEGESRPVSARDEMMAEIGRRRREAIDRELRQGEDLADDARRNAGLEPAEHARESDAETARETAHAVEKPVPVPTPARPALRSIEIDGQHFQVTDEQMAELASLGARANVAMQRQQQMAAQQQQIAAQQPRQQDPRAMQPAPAARPSVLSKADAEAVADRLLYGGKEQVTQTVQALADHIAQQSRAQQVAPDAIAAEATRRAIEYHQFQSDLTQLSKEYPDIWASQALGELAAVQLGHVRRDDEALGVRRSNLDSYREAANRVLDALGKPRPGSTQAAQAAPAATRQTPDRATVLERKRAAPTQPTGIDRRAAGTPQTARHKSGSDIVAAMRQSRGQMSMK